MSEIYHTDIQDREITPTPPRSLRRHATRPGHRLHPHKAADRVLHYLESEGTDGVVTLAQSRKAWAVELGLSHEALYRTLRQVEHDGLLKVSENRIECVT